MFDLSDHALTQISTWAEVGILLFMLWEKYGPGLFHARPPMTNERAISPAFWGRLWENKTIVVAVFGLALVVWLNLRQHDSLPADLTKIAAVTQERDTARQERDQARQATDAVLAQGDTAKRQIEALRKQVERVMTYAAVPEREAAKWRLANSLMNVPSSAGIPNVTACGAVIVHQANDARAEEYARDLADVFSLAGWKVYPKTTTRNLPKGIAVGTPTSAGVAYQCAVYFYSRPTIDAYPLPGGLSPYSLQNGAHREECPTGCFEIDIGPAS